MTAIVWMARSADAPVDAQHATTLHRLDGAPAGHLGAWLGEERPADIDARRLDRRVLDAYGPPGVLSIVLPPADLLIPFDDLAVQHARRRVLAEAPSDALSTLLIDDRHFAGAVTVRRGHGAATALQDDPFARLWPAEILLVGGGFFGRVPAPTGPSIERHGSAQPWPWDRFA